MNIEALKANKQLILAVTYGFAIGLSAGVLLEASGALAGLDGLIARRTAPKAPPEAKEVAPEPAEEKTWVDEPRATWADHPNHEPVPEAVAEAV